MLLRIVVLSCVCFVVIPKTNAYVKRDVTPPQGPNILDSFQKNIDDFRKCIDQSLAKTVSEVNEKQLQPALTVVGDQLKRVSKAYDDLTMPAKTTST